jgi:hypothetical protein
MRANEFINEDDLNEVHMAWGKTANKGSTKLKFRCTTGPRKSRMVSNPSDCYQHPNIAQSQRMKQTRARTAVRQARRAKFTKRVNPVSKLIKLLNKSKTI